MTIYFDLSCWVNLNLWRHHSIPHIPYSIAYCAIYKMVTFSCTQLITSYIKLARFNLTLTYGVNVKSDMTPCFLLIVNICFRDVHLCPDKQPQVTYDRWILLDFISSEKVKGCHDHDRGWGQTDLIMCPLTFVKLIYHVTYSQVSGYYFAIYEQ